MKTKLTQYASGIFLLGAMATAPAQSTWNYFISDAGGGNSLLTWSVTGSLATSPGAVLVESQLNSTVSIDIDAPGIFADTYAAGGAPQAIPTPDGSYFQLESGSVYFAIADYNAYKAPGSGNDSFGLTANAPYKGGVGMTFLYHPGTQSALIPIDYSDFNPGTYQSEESEFDTALTVTLTVGVVPEPSTLALSALGGLCGLLALRRWKKSLHPPLC